MAVTLTKDQETARRAFLHFLTDDTPFLHIMGAAGTGKSFLIRHLLETFESNYKSYCLFLDQEPETFDISVTATTNKAVAVVDDFLGHMPDVTIQTIYSLIGLRVVNNRETGKTTLEFNSRTQYAPKMGHRPLILIDEASFIDQQLQQIIEEILIKVHKAKVVYIGDPFQLRPPSQDYSVFTEVQCHSVTMREVKRNGGHILKVGTDFRKVVETGRFCDIDYNGKEVIHCLGPQFKQMVNDSYKDPKWTPLTSRILGWRNEKVQQYNTYIRKLHGFPELFQVGETVITNEFIHGNRNYSRSVDSEVCITRINQETETIYDVEGFLIELDDTHVGFMPKNFKDMKRVLNETAKAKDWKKHFEIKEHWLDLRAVYASSIHKSQGSTYETVFIDLTDIGRNFNSGDVARLLYVAITRASKRVVCYGFLPDRYCY